MPVSIAVLVQIALRREDGRPWMNSFRRLGKRLTGYQQLERRIAQMEWVQENCEGWASGDGKKGEAELRSGEVSGREVMASASERMQRG